MKKYNTPEMKVSMFSEESIIATDNVSSGFATYDAFLENNSGAAKLERDWNQISSELSITF